MKNINLFKWSVCSLASVAVLSAEAQLKSPAQPARNRVGASFRAAFNANLTFEGVGAFVPVFPTRLTPDGAPFNYDDGYVYPDDSVIMTEFTRYWGYDNAGQYVPADGTIIMHRSSSEGMFTESSGDDPLLGFELTYNRELGRNGTLRWGVEGAFNYLNVSVNDSRPLSLGYSRTGTPYQLPPPGIPPTAPYYHGAAFNPIGAQGNPVITTLPGATTSATAFATLTGARNFDADVFGFRVGPYLELPLGEKWALTFSGGLALALVNSDFSFNEAVALPNVPPVAGAGSQDDLLLGWYVAGNVNYQMSRAWGLFAGVQFQDIGNYRHTVMGRSAVLDLSQTIFLVVGVSYSF